MFAGKTEGAASVIVRIGIYETGELGKNSRKINVLNGVPKGRTLAD